jgi:crotonobetainyl-CoA:carnitine CoA-transferase CaiB-like acyl-CoA transferase
MTLLNGIRVVEMGLWLAGPATGGILSDWGADVIKIEPLSGDPMRNLYGHLSGSKESRIPAFDQHNRGKRSVALDINSEGGAELADRIAGSADVFLTNMRPAFLKRVRLDHETLLSRYPRLVYAVLTGYGLDGPDRDAPGFDVAAFSARTGVANRCAPEGEAPPTLAGGFGDVVTAISTTAAIMGGLMHRERTGKGQLVSTSLLRTGIYCISMDVATRLGLDRLARPASRTKPTNPMLNSYAAGDGRWFWLMGAEAERHWPRLVASIGDPEELRKERFASPRDRRRNGTELVALLDEIFAGRSRDEWAERFAEHDVWWAPVNSVEDLLSDPQVEASGAFVEVPADSSATGLAVATPVDFSDTPVGPSGPAPAIGADTDDVLRELGVDADEIERLHRSRTVGRAAAEQLPEPS